MPARKITANVVVADYTQLEVFVQLFHGSGDPHIVSPTHHSRFFTSLQLPAPAKVFLLVVGSVHVTEPHSMHQTKAKG